ncbi:NUDIX hydrolase [Patescibacteria group bacterium]
MIFLHEPENFDPQFEAMGCFILHGNNFILLHRLPSKPQGDTWGLPSGKFDPQKDKDIHYGMKRELKEETGIIYPIMRLELVLTVFVKYPEYDFIYHIYKVIVHNNPVITINLNEHDDYMWADPNEALKMKLIKDLDECIKLIFSF